MFHRVIGTAQGKEFATIMFQREMHEVQMRWMRCKVNESSREASTLYYWDIKYI